MGIEGFCVWLLISSWKVCWFFFKERLLPNNKNINIPLTLLNGHIHVQITKDLLNDPNIYYHNSENQVYNIF